MSTETTLKEAPVYHELYGGEIRIKFNPGDHSYWLETEETTKKGTPKLKRLPGVTTHIGMKDKSKALIPWAVGVTLDYVKTTLEDNLQHISGILGQDEVNKEELGRVVNIIDSFVNTDSDGMYEMAQAEAGRIKEEAGAIGSIIHEWVENYINYQLGQLPIIPEMPEDERVIIGVTNFLNWVDEHKVKFLWSEKVVYSKEHGYIGTADIGALIDGKFYLIDIKTGNGLYAEVKMQTGAYLRALMEELDIKEAGRMAIRIAKEDENQYMERMGKKKFYRDNPEREIPPFKVFEFIDFGDDQETLERDFNAYLSCKNIYEWDAIASKEMR